MPEDLLEVPRFIRQVPVVTADEREMLLSAAWTLNEQRPEPEPIPATPACGLRPGDDYAQRGDVRAVLLKHGWTLARPGAAGSRLLRLLLQRSALRAQQGLWPVHGVRAPGTQRGFTS
jgi:hypothetical protein